MKCRLNSSKPVYRTILLNFMFVWCFNIKKSLGDCSKHSKGLLMDIDYLVSQLYVQRCAFVEIGEGICSLTPQLFVDLPLDGNGSDGNRQVFLGQCSCAELSSWQLCGRKLAEQRPEDCTLKPESPMNSARVHYRLCDLTGMVQWNPQCNCSQPQREPLCGFRTCYSNPFPSSICSPRSPCGTASCDLALRGSLYSIQCDPSCKHHLPFCERPGPTTSARRDVTSDWAAWRPIGSPDNSNIQQFVADCLTPDRKPAFDCIGPGLQCCGDEEVDCICEVKLEESTLKAFRYSITFSADRPEQNSIKARSLNYKAQPQVWNRFIDLASKEDKSSDSLFSIQETKKKNNKEDFSSQLSEGNRDQLESTHRIQHNITDVYQNINESISQTNVESVSKNNVKSNEVNNKDFNIISTPPLLTEDSLKLRGTHIIAKPVEDGKLSINTDQNKNVKIKNPLLKDKTVDNIRLANAKNVINYIDNNIEAENSSITNKSKTANKKNSQKNSEGKELYPFKSLNTLKNDTSSQIKAQNAHNLSHSGENDKPNGNYEGINDDFKKRFTANATSESNGTSKHNNNKMHHFDDINIINKDYEAKHLSQIHKNISEIQPDSKNKIMTENEQLGNQLKITRVNSQPNMDQNRHDTNSSIQDTNNDDPNKINKIQISKPDLDKIVKINQQNSQSKLKNNDNNSSPHMNISSSKLHQVYVSRNHTSNSSVQKITTKLDSGNVYEAKDQKIPNNEFTKSLNASINEQHSITPGQVKKTTPALDFISDIVDLLPNSTPIILINTSHFGIPTDNNLINVTSFFVNPSHTPLNTAETNHMKTNITPKLTLANVAGKIFRSSDILSDQKDPLNKIESVDLLSLAVANYDDRGDPTLEKLYDEPEPVLKDLNVESVDDNMANALSSVMGVKHDPQKSTWTQINKKKKLSGDVAVEKHNSSGLKLHAIATT